MYMEDPYEAMKRFRRYLDDVFRDFFKREVDFMEMGARVPRLSVEQEKDSYVYILEMPGLSKNDVSITVDEGNIYIEGKKTSKKEKKSKSTYEFSSSTFSYKRVIPLPPLADPNSIKAEMKNGLLIIRVKKRKVKGKKVKIE